MKKIMVVEDEKDIRELIVFSLRFGGYNVVEVSNGEEAVKIAPLEKPDLIILDVRMPKMTGYEACQKLKGIPETSKIPVIFLSARGQERDVQQGMKLGAKEYILKPFAPDELLKKVEDILSSTRK
ncbi:MAG: response regulator transcription factor [Anaerolineae bacterium]